MAGCDRDKSSSSTTKKPRIAYVTNGVDAFWTVAEAGAKQGGIDFNADVTSHEPSGIENQKRIIEDLLTRGSDGIAISPIDPANQAAIINQACEKTNVLTHDSDAPGTKRLCYIGMDNYIAGRMTGQLVKEALPDGGKVMIFIGRLEQDNAKRRRQGVIDELLDRPADPNRYDPPGGELKGPKYTIVDTRTDQFDRPQAKANAEDAVSKYPDLGCMVGLFAYNPPACIEALKRAGKLGKIKLVAFDEDDRTLQAIEDGMCQGTVVQNPFMYGHESVRILAALARGDKSALPPKGELMIPARQIRKNNVGEFWKDKKLKLGEK
jgi:ribose transport system substrate-binding protein